MGLQIMNIQLRLEQPADYRETENVVRAAFWNHYSPGCNEHYLVHIMRGHPAFVPELNCVAVENGRIVGHIAYLKTVIKEDDGQEPEVLSLGPISVLPEYQRRGVGGRLIEHTRRLARDMGFRAIFLYGDPAYYSRRGFISAERLGIRTENNMYAAALHACALNDEALSRIKKGRYIEDRVYEIDQSAAVEFDKYFSPKEKVSGTPSQKRFEEVVAMRSNAI